MITGVRPGPKPAAILIVCFTACCDTMITGALLGVWVYSGFYLEKGEEYFKGNYGFMCMAWVSCYISFECIARALVCMEGLLGGKCNTDVFSCVHELTQI